MASSSSQTHYEILGITQLAQLKEVRDAYRKLALKCHPDKDPYNPRAVAAFQKLGAAYEILSDENRRTRYDATLSLSQKARQPPQPARWPAQRSSESDAANRARQDDMRRRTWDWSTRAERAAQARREDDAFWSGPTYAHGATYRSRWGEQWDRGQKDDDLSERRQQERAARKEARREAERTKRDINTPPPPAAAAESFNQNTEEVEARAQKHRQRQEAQEKFERERREDDGYWGKPPSPQYHDPDWSDKVERAYQEKLEKEKKERADRRKAKREELAKTWPTELRLLLSKIISIELDIYKTEAMVGESKRARKDEREDEDHEQIFDLPIKIRSLQRRLKECLDNYKRIVKWLKKRGREEEANEADVKLQEARKGVARDERAGHKLRSQGKQADSTAETKTEGTTEKDQEQPSAKYERSCPDRKTGRGKRSNVEQRPTATLPVFDGPDDKHTTRQQQASREYVTNPGVSYDGSDPERGFTEDTPEPSIAGDENDYEHEEYDPPFCNDFHDSHTEVHREFWDIIDSWHECSFCHKICTVMQCPRCDVQACAYCKDTHG